MQRLRLSHVAAPLVEANTVLNWAVPVRERVESASSAACVRLALAGAARAEKTSQRGAALARRSEAATAVFCVPPPPAQYAQGRLAELKSLESTASLTVVSAGISEKGLGARCTGPPRLSRSLWWSSRPSALETLWQPVISRIFCETAVWRVTGCWRGADCAR